MTATQALPAAPPGRLRLLDAFRSSGRPADLGDHLRRFGPPPAPRDLMALIDRAGLTGRGGGGFPTAAKIRSVAASARKARRAPVVLVNGGEGEPASTKDRLLLSVAPHLVLDGAMLAARALRAREVIIGVHPDTNLADHLEWVLGERVQARLDAVPASVGEIAGRYVASEESALVDWANGGRGLPAFTPPRPFERGVGGNPTLVANVETFAHLAMIARWGHSWFRSCGTAEEPGTALFTVSGAVRRPGVCEAPLGTPLGEVLLMAGGATEPIQAVLLGGYGGAWIPARRLSTPASRRDLTAIGAAMGPGIVVALPERACGLAETARVLTWMARQSAGQCGPCVHGLAAIAADFEAIAYGGGGREVLPRLRDRLSIVTGRGACGLPDGAVRFAASALTVFGDHVLVHQRQGGCLAARRRRGWTLPLPLPASAREAS